MITPTLLEPALAAFGVALFVAFVLVVTKRLHGHFSMDSQFGVQKFHTQPTPRIGGVAIVSGLVAGYALAPEECQAVLWPIMLAGTPAFVFGFLEDITKSVSVRTRLLATMACGVLGWVLTDISITNVNVPGLDWLLQFTVISVLFTAFAVAGVANAINIVDGFNGLAAGTIISILLSFALMAAMFGDTGLALACLFIAAPVAGFALVNWPLGKIFLGDGGAYFVGFAIAWLAVLMSARHPEVSAWAPLLACGYPILEVLFSMWRRHRRNLSPGDADRLHLHSLVKRRVVRRLMPQASSLARNSATGALMWLAALLPAGLALLAPTETSFLMACFVLSGVLYALVYRRLTRFYWFSFNQPVTKAATRRSPSASEKAYGQQAMLEGPASRQ